MQSHLANAVLIGAAVGGLGLFLSAQPSAMDRAASMAVIHMEAARPVTHRAWSLVEARDAIMDIAARQSMTLRGVEESKGVLEFDTRTTTIGLDQLFAQMRMADLRPTELSIRPIKTGIDDLYAHVQIDTKLPGTAKLADFVAGMRDVTAALPIGANTVWTISLWGDSKTGRWELTAGASDAQFVQDLLKNLQDGGHFGAFRLTGVLSNPPLDRTAEITFRIAMTSTRRPE